MIRFRPDSMDEAIYQEQGRRSGYQSLPIEDGDVVLDVGGHVGFFALHALTKGAARVVSFEANNANYQQGMLNTSSRPVQWFNKAVAAESGYGTLYLNPGINSGSHSLLIRRGRVGVPIEKLAFQDVVSVAPFQVAKIDIEGSEYDLDIGLLPDTCKALAMELHLNRKEWRHDKAPRMVAAIQDQGFRPIKEPTIGNKNWHSVGIWTR